MRIKVIHMFTGLLVLMATGCSKDNIQPVGTPVPAAEQMEYFDLNDTSVKANDRAFSIDLNHDGRKDIAFSTLLVGDPILQQDKLLFLVSTNIGVHLPVDSHESTPVLHKEELIPLDDFSDYHWFELSSVLLVQKIITLTAPVAWQGPWLHAVHRYIPYQLMGSGGRFNGWLELSVDVAKEQIIIHRAAISKAPEKVVFAGK